MTRTQAIDSAVKYAIRKFGYGPRALRDYAEWNWVTPYFRKAVLTAWDKINLKESV